MFYEIKINILIELKISREIEIILKKLYGNLIVKSIMFEIKN